MQKTPAALQKSDQKSILTCLAALAGSVVKSTVASKTSHTVNTKTVDAVRLHKLLDPGLVPANYVGVPRVQIRKGNLLITEPAVLLARTVAPLNATVWVVLFLSVYERRQAGKRV